MEEKVVFESNDEFLIEQVCVILKENNIPFIRRDDGAGSYINKTYGKNTTLSKRIVVNKEDYSKAIKLISFFNEKAEFDEEEIPEELKNADEDDEDKSYNRPGIIAGWILGIAFACLVAIWIVLMINFL